VKLSWGTVKKGGRKERKKEKERGEEWSVVTERNLYHQLQELTVKFQPVDSVGYIQVKDSRDKCA
jgi:hypothetical protein